MRMPDKDDHIIADWLRAHNKEEWAGVTEWECPRGHVRLNYISDGYALSCAAESEATQGVSCDAPVTRRWIPHDFTNPTYLTAAVEAFLQWAREQGREIRLESITGWCDRGVAWETRFKERDERTVEWLLLSREAWADRGKSERAALAAAITAEKGE